jgi:hypothetical protein
MTDMQKKEETKDPATKIADATKIATPLTVPVAKDVAPVKLETK